MKSSVLGLSLCCLFGLSFASPIAAAADNNNVVPNRNMPQKTEPYVDFGISGFLYKNKRDYVRSSKKQQDKKHKVTTVTPIVTKGGGVKKIVPRQAQPATKMVTDNNNSNNSSSSGGDTYPNDGTATFFSPSSRGSCGLKSTNSDFIVAISEEDMDNEAGQAEENPNCGKMIEIVNAAGVKIQAKVVDTCPECSKGDLDLSPSAYVKLAPFSQGIVQIQWKFLN